MAAPIWLIGMMGSGKSTVAPLVAAALGRACADTDAMIEERQGETVAEIFADSEEAFRDVEVEVIESLAAGSAVVATGGGAVTTPAAEAMRSRGLIVWLRATADTLARRVGDGASRPLLSDDAALARIERERTATYAALGNAVVDTDDLDPAAVANLVVEACANASSEV